MDATDLDDPMQTCPYDSSHRILKSRMQWHLVRCRKNHPVNKDRMKTCPYDAVHVVNVIEYEYHVSNCPKSGSVYQFLYSTEGQRSVGSVSLEKSNSVYVPPSQENWDEDPPAPTYNPLQQAKNRNVLLSETGLSKAKKRQFKIAERLRIQALEESGVNMEVLPQPAKEDLDKPLRKPHKNSHALVSDSGKENLNDPEIMTRLRPPKTQSVALSVCSNTDYEDEILGTNKTSMSMGISESPAQSTGAVKKSINNSNPGGTPKKDDKPDLKANSVKNDNFVPCEVKKEDDEFLAEQEKVHLCLSSSKQVFVEQSNKTSNENTIEFDDQEDEAIDAQFLLSDLATSGSSSGSNTDDDNDSDIFPDLSKIRTALPSSTQSDVHLRNQSSMNHSIETTEEATSRLKAIKMLTADFEREKAKIEQTVYELSQESVNPNKYDSASSRRCAANFPSKSDKK